MHVAPPPPPSILEFMSFLVSKNIENIVIGSLFCAEVGVQVSAPHLFGALSARFLIFIDGILV